MTRTPRLASLFAASLLAIAACSGGAAEQRGPQIALTHQWRVPQGVSLFVENSMGTAHPEAADALMAAMPNVVHRLGERCKGEAALQRDGAITVEFTLEGQKAGEVRVDPANACVVAGVSDEIAAEAALAGVSPTIVVLHLKHAPLS